MSLRLVLVGGGVEERNNNKEVGLRCGGGVTVLLLFLNFAGFL